MKTWSFCAISDCALEMYYRDLRLRIEHEKERLKRPLPRRWHPTIEELRKEFPDAE